MAVIEIEVSIYPNGKCMIKLVITEGDRSCGQLDKSMKNRKTFHLQLLEMVSSTMWRWCLQSLISSSLEGGNKSRAKESKKKTKRNDAFLVAT